MAITIVQQQQDDENFDLWHFKISGPDSVDGTIRLADLSRETTSPTDWLAANQAEAQAAIDAGTINEEYNEGVDFHALLADIATELAWLKTVPGAIAEDRAEIVTGIGVIDTPATLAQLRGVVRGLCLIVDDMLQRQSRLSKEQEGELKAWRYTIRQLG